MRILHVCPTSALDSAPQPPSLEYLGHQVVREGFDRFRRKHAPPERGRTVRQSTRFLAPEYDLVLADASLDLSIAPQIAEVLDGAAIDAPIIVVLSEGGLATAATKWRAADIILTTAGPAEVEARLRLARDSHSTGLMPIPGARSGSVATRRAGADQRGSTSAREAEQGPSEVIRVGGLRIDETAFTADLDGRSLDLTYREFSLLRFFANNPERVFTRDDILTGVWGDDYYGGTRTVDVHVRRLRAKLGKDLENAIYTVRNVGYRFTPQAASDDSSDDGSNDADDSSDDDGSGTTDSEHDGEDD